MVCKVLLLVSPFNVGDKEFYSPSSDSQKYPVGAPVLTKPRVCRISGDCKPAPWTPSTELMLRS